MHYFTLYGNKGQEWGVQTGVCWLLVTELRRAKKKCRAWSFASSAPGKIRSSLVLKLLPSSIGCRPGIAKNIIGMWSCMLLNSLISKHHQLSFITYKEWEWENWNGGDYLVNRSSSSDQWGQSYPPLTWLPGKECQFSLSPFLPPPIASGHTESNSYMPKSVSIESDPGREDLLFTIILVCLYLITLE